MVTFGDSQHMMTRPGTVSPSPKMTTQSCRSSPTRCSGRSSALTGIHLSPSCTPPVVSCLYNRELQCSHLYLFTKPSTRSNHPTIIHACSPTKPKKMLEAKPGPELNINFHYQEEAFIIEAADSTANCPPTLPSKSSNQCSRPK